MTVYELIQRLSEAPAEMEVLVNVVADGMDYEFEDRDGRDRCIGIDIDKNVEINDAYERAVGKERKMVIDLYTIC